MNEMKNIKENSQEQVHNSSSVQPLSPIPQMEPTSSAMMELHHDAVPKNCVRQASFPVTPLPTQMIACPTRQMSLPAQVSSESNGFIPKPLTTSQHHPPKITLLNRSPAVNLSSPTPTDSISQPSSAEDLQMSSTANFPDGSVMATVPEPSIEDVEALASARPPLSTDSSFDYKDSSGIDLHEFIVKTLRENPRDRLMLLKLEKDFTGFIRDDSRVVYRYPPMTSYHRMLVHRVAAYFGLDHNVDQTGQCVIVNKNSTTRIPECTFQMYCSREYTDEEISQLPRAILKRANSSEESATPPRHRSPPLTPKTLEDKKSRSIEEREHEYEKARARIFKDQSVSSQSSVESAEVGAAFTNVPQNPSVPLPTTDETRPTNVPPRFQDWGEQKNAEREAAIAAAAAATGNEGGKVRYATQRKRFPEYEQGQQESVMLPDVTRGSGGFAMYPGPGVELQMGGPQAMMGGAGVQRSSSSGVFYNIGEDSITPGSVWVNPATGQHVSAHDASQMVYPQGYALGRPMYQSPHPIHPHGTQQTPYPYVMPVQYPGGQQQHYYVVQPQGDRTGMQPSQEPVMNPNQPPVGFHDVTGQFANLSIRQRHGEFKEEDTASTDSYSTTPTPPSGAPGEVMQQMMMSGSPCVMISQQRPMMSGQVYQNPVPMQYIPRQGYMAYGPYPQYVTVPDVGSRYPQSQTPPVQQARSPSPILMGSPYLANPQAVQPHISRPSPVQTPPFSRTPPPSSGSFIRNAIPGSIPGGAMIIPMAQPPAGPTTGSMGRALPAQQGSPAPHTHWKSQSSRRGGKSGGGASHEMINYQALAQEGQRVQQNIASFNRPPVVKMIQVPQHFQLVSGQRFQNRSPYNQYATHPQATYRRGKPRTQHKGTKLVNTAPADDERKTVNHILEVCDLPDGLSTNESDNLFKELENAGGRILRINNSSVGSATQTTSGPTVLAIFKSASDAQSALEKVSNPKFKLRVSQKSPTHFAADSNVATKNNNSPST